MLKKYKIGDEIVIDEITVKAWTHDDDKGYSHKRIFNRPVKAKKVYVVGLKNIKSTKSKQINDRIVRNFFTGSFRVLEVRESIGRKSFLVPANKHYIKA
ncbi:MAG: hypothetical protein GY777_13430 [Candidatus Brocadiaceae bacterium]|nr:hypothetical protein [Candidatus Brocadiaceae bacterium]